MTEPLLPHQLRGPCGCGDVACARPASSPTEPKASGLAALAPVLACAFCPACLSLYAKLASAVGAGLAIGEVAHTVLLGVAMLVSIAASSYRYRATRRGWPFALSWLGVGLMTLAHVLGELTSLELAGMGALVASVLVDRFSLDRVARRAASTS